MKSDIYRLICRACAKGNIGQTGRNVLTRLNEHVQAFHNNSALQNFLRIYSKINITWALLIIMWVSYIPQKYIILQHCWNILFMKKLITTTKWTNTRCNQTLLSRPHYNIRLPPSGLKTSSTFLVCAQYKCTLQSA